MSKLRVKSDSPYGVQYDLFMDRDVFVRVGADGKGVKIMLGELGWLHIQKDSAIFKRLKEAVMEEVEKTKGE